MRLLVDLAIFSTMVAGFVQAYHDPSSKCEIMSEILADHFGENISLEEFIHINCPTEDFLRKIYLMTMVANRVQDITSSGPGKQYRIYTEQKEDQADWLEAALDKVSEYFSELADLIAALPERKTTNNKSFEYPTSSLIDGLLDEYDSDKRVMISDSQNYCYLLNKSFDELNNQGFNKFLKVLEENNLREKVFNPDVGRSGELKQDERFFRRDNTIY